MVNFQVVDKISGINSNFNNFQRPRLQIAAQIVQLFCDDMQTQASEVAELSTQRFSKNIACQGYFYKKICLILVVVFGRFKKVSGL